MKNLIINLIALGILAKEVFKTEGKGKYKKVVYAETLNREFDIYLN